MSGLGQFFVTVVGTNPVVQGLVAGVVIASLNLLGALGILLIRHPSRRLLDTVLAFSGGVMIAASFTSLLLPGIHEYGGLFSVVVGFLAGMVVLDQSDKWLPHVFRVITGRIPRNRAAGGHGAGGTVAEPSVEMPATGVGSTSVGTSSGLAVPDRQSSGVILFILAVTIHNLPEGLAVGVGFGAGNIGAALALMLAIGIQNIPEGFACAVGARAAGWGRGFYPALTGIRAGLVEIPLAVCGAAVVVLAEPVLPYAMGFAAGCMLYVVAREIIPRVQSHGHHRRATLGLGAGLLVMLSLDVALA